jgi:ferredoxin
MPKNETARGGFIEEQGERPGLSRHAQPPEDAGKTKPHEMIFSSNAPPSPLAQRSLIPCQFACPLRVNVPEMLQAASSADWGAAWRIFAEASPLPFCTAYLCRGECMSACRPRDRETPVDMPRIVRAAAEHALETDPPEYAPAPEHPRRSRTDNRPGGAGPCESRFDAPVWSQGINTWTPGPRFGLETEPEESACALMEEPCHRVAVVGAAPAALAAAYHLAIRGCQVTVFSSADAIGGWLQTAAAGLSLPLKALQRDITALRSLGVAFEELQPLEKTRPSTLRERGYDVVLAAPETASADRRSALVRDCFRGLVDADAFVAAAARQDLPLPGRTVVLGTGFDAAQAARMASMHGCPDITLLIHASAQGLPLNSAEIRTARGEGVGVIYCDLLKARITRKSEVLEVNLPGLENAVAAEMILLDGSIMPHTADNGRTITLGPAIPPALALDVQSMLTDTPGVFAIDPIRLANHSIAEELAQGGRAAAIAGEFLEGHRPPTGPLPVWTPAKQSPATPSSDSRSGETMGNTSNAPATKSAAQEAARCTGCNTTIVIDHRKCNGCLLCLEMCPVGALYATDETGKPMAHPWRRRPVIHVDGHLCERCRACIEICPVDAVSMRTLTLRRGATPL